MSTHALLNLARWLAAATLLSSCTTIATDTLDDGVSCPAGTKSCSKLQACVSVDDPKTGCGSSTCEPCVVANAVAKCVEQKCVVDTCTDQRRDCNDDVKDGCETNIMTNASKCGSCQNVCKSAEHAAAQCTDGVCGILCEKGYGDCDKNKSNGCETALGFDAANCGGCGKVCESGKCSNGLCQP